VSEREAPEGGGKVAQFLPPVSGSGVDGEVGENRATTPSSSASLLGT
jgi:hypothetical protein